MNGTVVPIDRNRVRDEVRMGLSDPVRTAELLGITDGSKRQQSGLLVRCPSHDERDPSCSITVGPDGTLRAKCFACDFSGDVFDLVAAVKGWDVSREFPRVLEFAAGLAGVSVPERREIRGGSRAAPAPRRAPAPPLRLSPEDDLGPLWNSLPRLDADAWEYLRGRGLDGAADWCRSLADPGTAAPVAPEGHARNAEGERKCGGARACPTCRWEYARSGYLLACALRDPLGRVVAIQVRNIRAEKGGERDNRFLAVGPTSAGVFGDPTRLRAARNVVLAEGMTDSLAALAACAQAQVTVAIGVAGVNAGAALDALAIRGKRVVVASDPDAAGDLFYDGRTEEEAQEETGRSGKPVKPHEGLRERLERAGAIPLRARPEAGSDLASMAAAGADLPAFFRAALSQVAGFKTAEQRLRGERQERLSIGQSVIPFGIRFLDLALGGIFPTDLILVGGETSHGKTEMVRIIAQANASRGMRVHHFALEAEPKEIERRAKYALVVDKLLTRVGGRGYLSRLNFLDWYKGELDDLTGSIEDEVDAEVAALYRNYLIYYPDEESEKWQKRGGRGFGIADFEEAVLALGDDTDLIVLDHFHFFDLGENENRAAKDAIKRIRALVGRVRKPIIVVAHIRKAANSGGKRTRLIPVLDDFHGSSDIVKIATKAVFIAKASDREPPSPERWPTYISAGKCRIEGSRARYAGMVLFDATRRRYESDFILGTVSPSGDKFTDVLPSQQPAWARRRKPEQPPPPAPEPTEAADAEFLPPPPDPRSGPDA